MITRCLLLAMCFVIATASSIGYAQSPAPATVRDKPKQPTTVQVPADANSGEERLALAIQIVSSLADEARSYKDESLKVKVQARAADVLWNLNKDRARSIFERAWDTAQTVDQDGRRAIEEKRRLFLSGASGIGFIPPPPNLRAEVLRLVSRHDRTLAEKFLANMDENDKRDDDANKVKRSWDPTEPSEAVAKRLQLARELLERGQLDAAIRLAQPGLNRVTSDGTIFLVLLRQKNAPLADQLFTALLSRTTADPLADATCVSLLASYALTPSVLVTFTRHGLLMNPWTDTIPMPQLSPSLRNRFFESIAQVLMRPTSIADLELTSAGVRGTAFTIRRLLPLFEQTFPALATGLQNRLDQLQQQTDIAISDQQRSFINAGFEPKKTEDESDDTLSQVERARSTRERNQLYAVAAQRAALRDDLKARELVDKIEDEEYRKSVRNFVDVVLISKAKEKRDADKASQLTRTAELSHFQRVWAYTEIATLLEHLAQEQAINLITQAIAEAGRIERSSSESPEAQTAIASTAMKLDEGRTEDMLLDVVKAANDSDTFTGEENSFTVDFQARGNIARVSISAPNISLGNLFATLAKDDLRRAATIAEGIKAEAPRAVALLACASSVLTKNSIIKDK